MRSFRDNFAWLTPCRVSSGRHDRPFGKRSPPPGGDGLHLVALSNQNLRLLPVWATCTTPCSRLALMDCASSAVNPQGSHRISTAGAQPRPVVHIMWTTGLYGAPLRCRTVSQTPTYDQLRGERINADVPAGEADPHPAHRTGRHRIRDDMPAGSAVSDLGPGGDPTANWSGSAPGDSNRSGKHQLRHRTPRADPAQD